MLISLLEVCQEGGVKKGATWRTLRVPDRRHGGQGHPWYLGWCFFTLRKIPWKFRVSIFIRSVSGMRGQEGGYLEDVEGSWPETWRTGSSMTLWMYLVAPRILSWKFRVIIFIFGWNIRVCYHGNINLTDKQRNLYRKIQTPILIDNRGLCQHIMFAPWM